MEADGMKKKEKFDGTIMKVKIWNLYHNLGEALETTTI